MSNFNKIIKKPQHGFDIKEFELRINKAHQMMYKNKLDALLITTPHNFRYFTGFDSYFWESPTRPWFLIIPINKEPIAVIPSIGRYHDNIPTDHPLLVVSGLYRKTEIGTRVQNNFLSVCFIIRYITKSVIDVIIQ